MIPNTGKGALRFAIIGSFWLTKKMISVIDTSDKAFYAAQYSRSLERAREFVGDRDDISTYDNIDDLAKDESIDAVYIASPNYLHYEHSKKMLLAGKHVLCEKPITVHPWQYSELCELSNKNQLVYMEAMMNAHHPMLNELSRIISEADGKIVGGNINFCKRSSKLDNYSKGIIASTFDKKCCGGALMDLGIYVISLLVRLFGVPNTICGKATFGKGDADITDALQFVYDDFTIGANISKVGTSVCPSEIMLEDRSILIGDVSRFNDIRITCKEGSSVLRSESSFEFCMKNELDNFIGYACEAQTDADYKKLEQTTLDEIKVLKMARDAIGYNI